MEPTLANAQFSCHSYKAARLTRNVRRGNYMKMESLSILTFVSFIFIIGCKEEQEKVQQTTIVEKDSGDLNNLPLAEFNWNSNDVIQFGTNLTEKYIQELGSQTNLQGKHIIIESGHVNYPMVPGDKTLIDDRWRSEIK